MATEVPVGMPTAVPVGVATMRIVGITVRLDKSSNPRTPGVGSMTSEGDVTPVAPAWGCRTCPGSRDGHVHIGPAPGISGTYGWPLCVPLKVIGSSVAAG